MMNLLLHPNTFVNFVKCILHVVPSIVESVVIVFCSTTISTFKTWLHMKYLLKCFKYNSCLCVGQCIGKGNRPTFVLFLFFQCLESFVYGNLFSFYFKVEDSISIWIWKHGLVFLLWGMAWGTFFLTGGLMLVHFNFICTNQVGYNII